MVAQSSDECPNLHPVGACVFSIPPATYQISRFLSSGFRHCHKHQRPVWH